MSTERTGKTAGPTSISPWTEFDRFLEEFTRPLRYGLAGPFFPSEPSERRGVRAARTDVTDTGAAFRVVAELPGIPKDRLDVRLRGRRVEIRAESTESSAEPDGAPLHRERQYFGFYRAIELPEPVVAKSVTAKVDNGLLVLELPKEHPPSDPAEIQVRVQ